MAEHNDHADYLKFLENLSDDQLDALVTGKAEALVAHAGRAYELLGPVMAAEQEQPGGGEAPWMERVRALSTQEEAVQVAADLEHLKSMIQAMQARVVRRLKKLHIEQCEECRAQSEQEKQLRKRLQKGLEAAKAAFAEALDDDDEPWKQSADDEDDGVS